MTATSKITLAALKARARELGMSVRKTDGEYRVAFLPLFNGDNTSTEASASYATDAEEAYDTMEAMHRTREAAKPVVVEPKVGAVVIEYVEGKAHDIIAFHGPFVDREAAMDYGCAVLGGITGNWYWEPLVKRTAPRS